MKSLTVDDIIETIAVALQELIEEDEKKLFERIADSPVPGQTGWLTVQFYNRDSDRSTEFGRRAARVAVALTCDLLDQMIQEDVAQEKEKEKETA